MKIMFLVSSLGAGGAERVAVSLCNAWSKRGDQVILVPTFSGRGDCFYPLNPSIELVYLADLLSNRKKYFIDKYYRLKALRTFIIENKPDVIISFLSNVNLATIISCIGLNVSVIICERTDPFVFPTTSLLRIGRSIMYPFANGLVVQTQSVALKYESSPWNLQKITVIPNPVPKEFFEITRVYNKPGADKFILGVGRLDEGKKFDILIKVFSNIIRRHSECPWKLKIIGEGPLKQELQQQINNLGLEEKIELHGKSDNIEKNLEQSDIFVLTSKVEGFPNALLEAMASGLPCVTFDCPSGPKEISMNGQVALLAPLNDELVLEYQLETLMCSKSMRKSLGNLAKSSIINRFTLERILENWDLLFQTVKKS